MKSNQNALKKTSQLFACTLKMQKLTESVIKLVLMNNYVHTGKFYMHIYHASNAKM